MDSCVMMHPTSSKVVVLFPREKKVRMLHVIHTATAVLLESSRPYYDHGLLLIVSPKGSLEAER
jgi:hypothetical protein